MHAETSHSECRQISQTTSGGDYSMCSDPASCKQHLYSLTTFLRKKKNLPKVKVQPTLPLSAGSSCPAKKLLHRLIFTPQREIKKSLYSFIASLHYGCTAFPDKINWQPILAYRRHIIISIYSMLATNIYVLDSLGTDCPPDCKMPQSLCGSHT